MIEEDFETGVGDEGGFEPRGLSARTALDFLEKAASVQYDPGNNVFFGLDIASGSFYENGKYHIDEENLELSSDEVIDYYERLFADYKIIYLEDPLYERDEFGWTKFYKQNKDKYMIVADDLVVTNPKILERISKEKMASAVIVKPNQVGTLSETLDFIKLARKSKMDIVISHRSGDNIDSFISDLAIAVDADFIKSGAPARGEGC